MMCEEKKSLFFHISSVCIAFKNITKVTKPIFALFLLIIMTLPQTLQARVYGSLILQYGLAVQESYNSTVEQERMVQTYRLGHNGYLYSPLLFSYDMSGDYTVNDTTTQADGNEMANRSEMTGYKASMRFIEGSFMPFTISLYKTTTPTWNYNEGDASQYSLSKSDSSDLSGRLVSRLVNFSYSAGEVISTSENIRFNSKTHNKYYGFTLAKKIDTIDFRSTYQHKEESSEYHSFDSISDNTYENNYDTLDALLSWKTSSTLSVSSSAYYLDSQTYGFQNTYANVGLSWAPTNKFTASTAISTNNYVSAADTSAANSISENINYKYTTHWNFSQSLSLMQSASDLSTTSASNLNLGSSYTNVFDETYHYGLSADIHSSISDLEYTDANQTASSAVQQGYGLHANVSRRFSLFNTNLSTSASYNGSTMRNVSETNSFGFGTGLSSSFTKNIAYSLGFSYSSVETDYFGDYNGSTSYSYHNLNQSLQHSAQLSHSTSVSNRIGMNHSHAYATNTTITNYYGSHSLSSHLYRSLSMNYMLSADASTQNDFVNYQGIINFLFYIGQISCNVNGMYAFIDDSNAENDRTNKSINFSIARSF